jgi:NADH:ubiquinone oxidoreductase subunit 6 (subunit J)
MDSLHAIGFYVSATLLTGGALLVAFLPKRETRGLALAAVGLGLAGVDLSLSAGFAGTVTLLCYLAMAWLFAGRGYRTVEAGVAAPWRQLAAVGAAGLLAVTCYAAFRADFVHATFYGGAFGVSSVGRLFFAHDALATEAVGALILIALVGATAGWRARERSR